MNGYAFTTPSIIPQSLNLIKSSPVQIISVVTALKLLCAALSDRNHDVINWLPFEIWNRGILSCVANGQQENDLLIGRPAQ